MSPKCAYFYIFDGIPKTKLLNIPLWAALDVEEVLSEVRVPVGVTVGKVDCVARVGEGQGEGESVAWTIVLLYYAVILVIPGTVNIEWIFTSMFA